MSYGYHAERLAGEVRDLLSETDGAALADDLELIGYDGWLKWEKAHARMAGQFLAATPAQRAKKKAWQGDILRRRLVLAAYRQARLAAIMLHDHGAGQDSLAAGSYREVTAAAGALAWRLHDEGEKLIWPWPDVRCPRPWDLG